MKTFNIAIASENKQREMAKGITGDNIKTEKGAFTFSVDKGGAEVREIPFVYLKNLTATETDTITQHKWHVFPFNKKM